MVPTTHRRSPAEAPRYQKRRSLTALQQLRLARGKDQRQVAEESACDESAISYWETFRREPRGPQRIGYSRALGISIGELGRIIYEGKQARRAKGAP